MEEKQESNWMKHVRDEIRIGNVGDSFYGDLLPNAIIELAEVFDKQGHSGMSAGIVSRAFYELANWRVLSPLTNDPEEWRAFDGVFTKPCRQSKRQPSAFSEDGGKTYRTTGDDKVYVSAEKNCEEDVEPCEEDEEWIPVSVETLKVLNQLRRPKESYDMAIGYLIDLYETEKILYEALGGKTHDGLGQTSRSETKHGN